MRRPFVWFTISLISGIIMGRYHIPIAAVTAAAAVFFAVRNRICEPLFMIPIAVIGLMLCRTSLSTTAGGLSGQDINIRGTVRESHATENGRTALRLDTEYVDNIPQELTLYVTAEEADVRPGDIIEMRARLYEFKEPANPYESNYKIRMLSDGYDCSAWCREVQTVGRKKGLLYSIESARENVNLFFDENMPPKEAGIAKALVTGYKYDIDEEINTAFKNLGISHVLAVSGLHVSIISGALFLILTKYLRMNKRIAIPIVSSLLIAYLIFTGASPSAMRAVIMSVTAFTALLICKNSDSYNTIAFSAFIILYINPLNLWNISFQLSYVGIAAVVIARDILKDMKNPLLKTVMFSSIVWIITTPLVMYYFGGFSIVSVISNIAAVPYLSLVTGLSLGSGVLSVLSVGKIIAAFVHLLLKLYIFAAEKIPTGLLYVNTVTPSLYAVFGIYIFFAACVVLRKKKYMPACVVLLAVLWLKTDVSEIVFFDCGQGDASAIYIPGELTAVIDGGPNKYSPAMGYVRAKSGKADILFITHMDKDHSEGAIGLIENDMVKQVVISDVPHSERLDSVLKEAEKRNIPVTYAFAGYTFETESCHIECLYPDGDTGRGENSTSLVLKADIDGTKVLFTGDIEKDDELSLLDSDIECDIIKIAHHGSGTSSTEEFIKKTKADMAVIEAEEGNIYGFPDEAVMERLKYYGIDTYVTGKDGVVIVKIADGYYNR